MDKNPVLETPANCNPVFSIAGATPGGSEVAWKTAYPNPDALVSGPRPPGNGPTFTIAGVMPGKPEAAWRTAMPDPSRDVLDANGHVITKAEAKARAELSRPRRVLALRRAA